MSENVSESMAPELLLVDDNEIQAATRQTILSRAGMRVLVASHPADALKTAQRPDVKDALRLIITDHLMPDMNGPEMVRELRALLPDIPVLVLSGLPGAEAEYGTLQVCFRLKPLPPEELIRTARTMMVGRVLRSA